MRVLLLILLFIYSCSYNKEKEFNKITKNSFLIAEDSNLIFDDKNNILDGNSNEIKYYFAGIYDNDIYYYYLSNFDYNSSSNTNNTIKYYEKFRINNNFLEKKVYYEYVGSSEESVIIDFNDIETLKTTTLDGDYVVVGLIANKTNYTTYNNYKSNKFVGIFEAIEKSDISMEVVEKEDFSIKLYSDDIETDNIYLSQYSDNSRYLYLESDAEYSLESFPILLILVDDNTIYANINFYDNSTQKNIKYNGYMRRKK